MDDNLYAKLFGNSVEYFGDAKGMAKAIRKGTPLPQTFDLEGLKSDMKALNCGYPYGLDYLLDCLKKRLGITILEADKESEDKYA